MRAEEDTENNGRTAALFSFEGPLLSLGTLGGRPLMESRKKECKEDKNRIDFF